MRPTFLLALLFLAASPSDAQSLTLARLTIGDYDVLSRVDTSQAEPECVAPPVSLLSEPREADCDLGYGPWLVLAHRGVPVDSVNGMQVWLGVEPDTVGIPPRLDGEPLPTLPLPDGAVQDLTGDGVPEVVLTAYTGGMHCCTVHYVVSLGDEPRLVGHINALDSATRLADLDGDGRAEFVFDDFSYAYWNTSFAGSPAPQVVLAWDGERFAPSVPHMQRTLLDDATLQATVRKVRAEASWSRQRFPPETYWGTLLDLLYAGQGEEATQFARDAWVGDAVGQRVFFAWLVEQIGRSPYGEAVLNMNADALYAARRW